MCCVFSANILFPHTCLTLCDDFEVFGHHNILKKATVSGQYIGLVYFDHGLVLSDFIVIIIWTVSQNIEASAVNMLYVSPPQHVPPAAMLLR